LALVRHAQASFFSANYDQLSPLGEQQARLLGEYWVRSGVRFDEVFTGPRVRQIETAALAGEAFARNDLPWPEPQMVPELDEHQVDKLIKATIRELAKEYPHIGQLHADYHAAEKPADKHRTFQLMFEEVVMLWVAFSARTPVNRAVCSVKATILPESSTARIALSTHWSRIWGNVAASGSAEPSIASFSVSVTMSVIPAPEPPQSRRSVA
jgi:broad specificity phosphatase PhoE